MNLSDSFNLVFQLHRCENLYIFTSLVSILKSMNMWVTSAPVCISLQSARLEIQQCQLSTELTARMWSCLRSFTSLNHLTISGSSLSFPPSPPELPSVTKLSAERVTSQSYERLLSSLPGLEEVDITIGDANTEDISQIQTSLRRHLTGQDFTCINPHSIGSEGNVSSMSTKRMRGLGLLVIRNQALLAGVVFGPKETVIDLVQSSTRLISASLYLEQWVTVKPSKIDWSFLLPYYNLQVSTWSQFKLDKYLLKFLFRQKSYKIYVLSMFERRFLNRIYKNAL